MKTHTLSLTFLLILFLSFCDPSTVEAQTFEYKDSGSTFIIYDVSIPPGSNTVAYAATSKFTSESEGSILKSTDAGETWEKIYPLSGIGPSFEKIEFVTENKGFAVGYDLVLKTVDGGLTWTELSLGTEVYLYNNLTFFNENVGLISAQLNDSTAFAIYLTTDGGDTWTNASDVINAGGIEIAYADENTLFSVGADELISKSTDGGDTWNQIYSGVIQNYFVSTFFKDANNGIVSSEEGTLKTTHDGGETWTDFTTGYHFFFGLAYRGNQLLAAGTDEDIYSSNDNGDTWSLLYDGAGFNQLNEIALFADGSGLICGGGGTIIKFNDVLGVDENSIKEKSVSHFYNSDTQIFTLQSNNSILNTITFHTISGQKIASFNNNSETFSIDVSEFSSGIYLVSITSNNYKYQPVKFLKF